MDLDLSPKEAEKAQRKGKKSGDTTLNPLYIYIYIYTRHCASHFTWVITTVPTTNDKDTIRVPI